LVDSPEGRHTEMILYRVGSFAADPVRKVDDVDGNRPRWLPFCAPVCITIVGKLKTDTAVAAIRYSLIIYPRQSTATVRSSSISLYSNCVVAIVK